MATRALPMVCILFLLFSASLILPSAEGARTPEEISKDASPYNSLNPTKPSGSSRPGEPYTRRCGGGYYCPPAAKP